MMYSRYLTPQIQLALQDAAAVVLLGPRQIGKTTLAYELSQPGGIYLDLESFEDRSKLAKIEQYLREYLSFTGGQFSFGSIGSIF